MFVVQVSETLSITNSSNNKVCSFDLSQLFPIVENNEFSFIVDEKDIEEYSFIGETISDSWLADTVIITEENYKTIVKKDLKKIILKVSNMSLLAEVFASILDYSYYIDILVDTSVGLKEQVDKMVELLGSKKVIVPLLNGYYIKKEKFDPFGEKALFIANGLIYYHPDFYYNSSIYGVYGKIDDYIDDEITTHFTKPHLLCCACNCFYCNRNIYNNKIVTSEYKTPSSMSCSINTIFANASKRLFNELVGKKMIEEEDLDPFKNVKDKIEASKIYEDVVRGAAITNRIKEMDFQDRFFK